MSTILEKIEQTKNIRRLGDLVAINELAVTSDFRYPEIEYIDTSSVTQNIFQKPQLIKTSEAPGRARRLVREGDTILSTVRPSQKHFGFIQKPKDNTVVSTGFVVLTPKHIDSRYLYSYLTKDSITAELNAIAEATTTTFPAFKPEILMDMKVEIPDLPTQKRIGELLGAYDKKIENNNIIIKNLETTAQTLFDEWFVKFRFPGYEKIKLVESEMGMIPEGWKVQNVLDVIERIGVGKKYDNNSALPTGKVQILDQGRSGNIGYHNDAPGVIANIDNPVVIFTNHTCYYRLMTEPFSCIQNVLPYIGKNDYPTLFIYFLTKDKITMQEYKGHWPDFEQQHFMVPPVPLAQRFVDR
jgi:type I restriction enzyme, S subunit